MPASLLLCGEPDVVKRGKVLHNSLECLEATCERGSPGQRACKGEHGQSRAGDSPGLPIQRECRATVMYPTLPSSIASSRTVLRVRVRWRQRVQRRHLAASPKLGSEHERDSRERVDAVLRKSVIASNLPEPHFEIVVVPAVRKRRQEELGARGEPRVAGDQTYKV